MRAHLQKYNTRTRLFTAALTVIVKYLKQSKCPSIENIKTMEYYGMLRSKHINKLTNQGSFLYTV